MKENTTLQTVRGLLDRLISVERLSDNDEKETAHNEAIKAIKELPRPRILAILDEAVGKNKSRKLASVYILSELTDVPEVIIRIKEMLTDPDSNTRSMLVQTIEFAQLTGLADYLSDIIENDPDEFVRSRAIHAAGTLKAQTSLPVLLRLANSQAESGEQGDMRWHTLWALQAYTDESCRQILSEAFMNPEERQHKVIAAWGLGKLGDKEAIKYLIAMLEVPYSSLRAAQALCEIYGWEFKHNLTRLNEIRQLTQEIKL